jgi:thymidine kinase
LKTEIFKPAVDTRYHDSDIVSHDQNRIPSTPVDNSSAILLLSDGIDVVGIDEAQFFDYGIVEVCNQLANRGIRVIVAGLDMDSEGRPFGPMPFLMATAEYVTKVHAICTRTGELAHFSYRKKPVKDQIFLGEKEEYEPLSRRAFIEARKKEQN